MTTATAQKAQQDLEEPHQTLHRLGPTGEPEAPPLALGRWQRLQQSERESRGYSDAESEREKGFEPCRRKPR